MSLDVAKLEKVRELTGGMVQARCPACAEDGNDRTGEHLRIYPDGKFGCCVHPKDGEHRKRIWALAGCKRHLAPDKRFGLRLKAPPALPAVRSVKAALTAFENGTLGTGESELAALIADKSAQADLITSEIGTLGTANVKLRACARVDVTTTNIDKRDVLMKLEDSESAVLSVPALLAAVVAAPCGEPPLRLPFLTADGTLVIPVALTRAELETSNIQHSIQNIEPTGKEIHAVTV
jgi:hypothetical protein